MLLLLGHIQHSHHILIGQRLIIRVRVAVEEDCLGGWVGRLNDAVLFVVEGFVVALHL